MLTVCETLQETGQEVPEFLVEEAKTSGPYSAPPSRRSGGGFGGRDFRESFRPRSAGALSLTTVFQMMSSPHWSPVGIAAMITQLE